MENKVEQIVMVPISQIVPNDKNNNVHTKEQKERAHKIFDAQGFRSPLLISKRTGKLVAGHLRLEVAREKGVSELPCMFQDFDSEEQEYQHLTADNALASWSELDLSQINQDILQLGPFDIDMLGIKDFVIEPIEKFEPQSDEDNVPEVVHPITRKGDLWLLGNHRLLCGDSTMIDDVERLMNGEKADMVFTDPPYGDNHASMEMNREAMRSGVGNIVLKRNKIKGDDDISFLFEVAANLSVFSKEKCPKIIFFKWSKWEQIKQMFSVFGEPSSCCVWDRDSIAAATFIFNPAHEFAFFWGSLAEKQNKSNLTNVWRCKKETENKKLHPTVKPIEIIENAIEAACKKNGLIIDFFLGSGSTLIACEKTNRKCYGMELDEHYCDVIIKRWEQYTGKKATLESTGQTYEELKAERDGQTNKRA